MQKLKLEYDNRLLQKVKDITHNSNNISYISANKTGKQLSILVKRVKRHTVTLKDTVSNMSTADNEIINLKFCFLKSVKFKCLSAEQKEDLRKAIGKAKTIYKSPTAQVYFNGTLSEIVRLKRGTRQGCPLSPFLFASEEESGINVDKENYKLSLFADDLMLYLTNTKTSLPKAMEIIEDFSKISGLQDEH